MKHVEAPKNEFDVIYYDVETLSYDMETLPAQIAPVFQEFEVQSYKFAVLNSDVGLNWFDMVVSEVR